MDKVLVIADIRQCHPRASGIHIAEVRKQSWEKGLPTQERVTLTHARIRAADVTPYLIIIFWAVRPAITQQITVYTGGRGSAPQESRTSHILTPLFILMVQAVVHSVAQSKDREAVIELSRTAVVAVRT